MRDGFPIGMGYFAVSFSLGIIAAKAGLTAWMGFVGSFLPRASAGDYGL
jgi:predicted branched-subunit amino acid permease